MSTAPDLNAAPDLKVKGPDLRVSKGPLEAAPDLKVKGPDLRVSKGPDLKAAPDLKVKGVDLRVRPDLKTAEGANGLSVDGGAISTHKKLLAELL